MRNHRIIALGSAFFILGTWGCSNTLPTSNQVDCFAASDCDEGMLCEDGLCVAVADTADATDATDATMPNEADASDATDESPDGAESSDPTDPSDDSSPVELPVPEVSFSAPADRSTYEAGEVVNFVAELSGVNAADGPFTVSWQSNLDGVLFETTVTDAGELVFGSDTLGAGTHVISLSVASAAGEVGGDVLQVGVCGWVLVDDFENEIDESTWLVHRDAYRDGRGWLEMTNNLTGKKGAIFNIGQSLQPGNVTMRFDIATGQCDVPDTSCSGNGCDADGFAVSVYKTNSEQELAALLESTQNGGGLGYTYVGAVCTEDATCPAGTVCTDGTCSTESFHIEFDTWYNGYDPTTADHVGIMLNGNNATHHLHQDIGNLEDNLWHEVVLTIQGTTVRVEMDNVEIIAGEVPSLNFKGGFIGFSGTTGACTNYHRFDNLYLQPVCEFN